MTNPTSEHREQARAIRFPFPCGCMDAHKGGGMTAEEYICAAHRAIAEALSSPDAASTRGCSHCRCTCVGCAPCGEDEL